MGIFEWIFKTKKRLEIIPITLVACNKDLCVLGINALKVDTTKIINSIKTQENTLELLSCYWVTIRLMKIITLAI